MKDKMLVFRDWVFIPMEELPEEQVSSGQETFSVVAPLRLTQEIMAFNALDEKDEASDIIKKAFDKDITNNPYFRAYYGFNYGRVFISGELTVSFQFTKVSPLIEACNMFYSISYYASDYYMTEKYANLHGFKPSKQVIFDNTIISIGDGIYPFTIKMMNIIVGRNEEDSRHAFLISIPGFSLDHLAVADDKGFERVMNKIMTIIRNAWLRAHPCFNWFYASHAVKFNWRLRYDSQCAFGMIGEIFIISIDGYHIERFTNQQLLIDKLSDAENTFSLIHLYTSTFSNANHIMALNPYKWDIKLKHSERLIRENDMEEYINTPLYLEKSAFYTMRESNDYAQLELSDTISYESKDEGNTTTHSFEFYKTVSNPTDSTQSIPSELKYIVIYTIQPYTNKRMNVKNVIWNNIPAEWYDVSHADELISTLLCEYDSYKDGKQVRHIILTLEVNAAKETEKENAIAPIQPNSDDITTQQQFTQCLRELLCSNNNHDDRTHRKEDINITDEFGTIAVQDRDSEIPSESVQDSSEEDTSSDTDFFGNLFHENTRKDDEI